MMGHLLRVAAPARVLRSREDHAAAMAELRGLMKEDPPVGSAAGERLELLAVLIQDYESRTFPVRKATPQEIVEFMADQQQLSRSELAALLGGRSRLSDFMNGVRPLSRGQISRLRARLGILPGLLFEGPKERGSAARSSSGPRAVTGPKSARLQVATSRARSGKKVGKSRKS